METLRNPEDQTWIRVNQINYVISSFNCKLIEVAVGANWANRFEMIANFLITEGKKNENFEQPTQYWAQILRIRSKKWDFWDTQKIKTWNSSKN